MKLDAAGLRPLAYALFLALAAPIGSTACGQSEQSGDEQTYETEGTIRRIDREAGSISIEHEDVPGYMPAMTMPFTVEDPHLFAGLAEGDRIHFRFTRGERGSHVVRSIQKR